MMKILYSAEAIAARVADLGETLNRQYKNEKMVHTIVTMNGAAIFAADLVRLISTPQVMHFTGGSYFQGAIKHEVSMNPETLPASFNHAPVLVIEDILDSGNSIRQLRQTLAERNAGEITVVTLFKRVSSPFPVEHSAFSLPRELFVVGYGLDMDGRFRELPAIYTFENTVMTGQAGQC